LFATFYLANNILEVIGIIGGLGCVSLCFIIPLIAYLSVMKE